MSNSLPQFIKGDDDFKVLLLSSNIFVDKSLFIKEILESASRVLLIARPRRWGKSLNLSMLKRFFEIEVDKYGNVLPIEKKINDKLFTGGEIDLGLDFDKKILYPLKISIHKNLMKQRQGKFPVILLSLQKFERK